MGRCHRLAEHHGQVRMPLDPTFVIAALLLLVTLGWGTVRAAPHLATTLHALGIAADTPVYRITDLQRQVARDPGDWIGQAVLVRGMTAIDRTWSAPDS